MPRIPTYKSKAVSLPRAPISKGAQEWEIIGHGLKETAGILAETEKKFRQAKQARLLSDAKTDSIIRQIDFRQSLDDRDDPENFIDDHTKLVNEIASDWRNNIKDPEVLNIFENHHKIASARINLAIHGIARTREIQQGKEDFYRKANEIKDRLSILGTSSEDKITHAVTMNELKSLVAGYAAAGFIDEKTANIKLKEIEHESTRANIWNTALSTMRATGYEDAVNFLNDSGLEPAEINSMAGALNREKNLQLAREKEIETEAIETWESEARKKFRTRELTFNDITSSPSKRKDWWIDKIDKQAKAAIKEEEDPFKITDLKIYGDLSGKINIDPDSIESVDEIEKYRGKGLSNKDTDSLVDRWESKRTKAKEEKKEDPLKADRAKRYHSILKGLMTDNIFDADENENKLIYGKKANLLDEYFTTHPNATDEEIEQFFKNLVQENKDGWIKRLWGTWANLVTFIPTSPASKEPSAAPQKDERLSVRQEALDLLKTKGYPITEKNIVYAMDKLEELQE